MRRLFIAALLAAPVGLLLSFHPVSADGPAGWGTVKGRIVWGAGALPAKKMVDVNKDQQHCLSKGPIPDEEWVVNPKNKGLEWTFVWIANADSPRKGSVPIHPALKAIKKKEVVMDQPCCKFIPHALGMRQGQTLLVKNSSPIAHNFKYDGNTLKGIGGNPLMPPKQSFKIKNLEADWFPIIVGCSIHPWMHGMVMVFDHPYFAVTDKNGAFEIKNAPAGDFRLVIRHSNGMFAGGAAGNKGRPITIKPGMNDLGDLEFQLPKN